MRWGDSNSYNASLAIETLILRPDSAEIRTPTPASVEAGHPLAKFPSTSRHKTASTNSLSIETEMLESLCPPDSRHCFHLGGYWHSKHTPLSAPVSTTDANPRDPGIPAIPFFLQEGKWEPFSLVSCIRCRLLVASYSQDPQALLQTVYG